MTPLQELTKKIQAHCPELSGLHLFEVGYSKCKYCETPRIVRDERHKTIIMDKNTGGSSGEVTVTEYDQTDMPCTKNLWKPITLEHVLKAIAKSSTGFEWGITCDGRIIQNQNGDSLFIATDYKWTLGLPLHLQSEPIINWLNTIIK